VSGRRSGSPPGPAAPLSYKASLLVQSGTTGDVVGGYRGPRVGLAELRLGIIAMERERAFVAQ
jgi:hypothetical protein